jgi:hypothetical protein
MDIYFKIVAGLALIIFVILSATAPAESSEWFLVSRHGECAEIKVLEKKIPDLSGVDSPATFIKVVQERGYEVAVKEIRELNGNAVQVDVPAKGLAVMFVKKELRKEFIQK